MTQLPLLVKTYVEAANAEDAQGVAACFQADGTVHDDGGIWRGRAAIAEWTREASTRYHATIEPRDLTEADDKCRLQASVSGNFPGSPVVLAFDFVLRAGGIQSLEITA
jgi:hypothetical protein